MAMGAPTAYAVERLIEPESFGRKGGNPIHRNKWTGYKHGKHTPNESLVARMDLHVGGSRKEINHVLWSALRQSNNASEHSINWLRQLHPELQILIFDGDDNVRNHGGRRLLEKLERRASMDALACLTILLCLNFENGNYEQAWKFAISTFRVLLMLGHHFESRGIADALFNIYVERIFKKIKCDEKRFYLEGYTFSQWAGVLHLMARLRADTKGLLITWPEEVHYMCRILWGKCGFDIKFALDPLIGPDRDIGPPRKKTQEEFDQAIRMKNRAENNIFPYGNERFPSPDVRCGHPPSSPLQEEPLNNA